MHQGQARRAAVWYGPEDLRVEYRPSQPLGRGDIRVAVTASGVCGSDVHVFYSGTGSALAPAPFILGHETAGVVLEAGPDVATLAPGDHVAIEPGLPCGLCEQCLRGTYNLCPRVQFFADPPTDGSFADTVVVDARFAYRVPVTMPASLAALAEPTACAVAACQRAEVGPGVSVLVTGAGPIGQIVTRVARMMGAARVVVSDVNPAKLELAARGGADAVVDARVERLADAAGEADALIECSGSASVVTEGVGLLARRGRAVLVGMGLGENVTLPVASLQGREVTVTGAFRFANVFPGAVALLERLDLAALVTHRFPLDRTADALRAPRELPECVKAMVHPIAADSLPGVRL
ncbi:MAG: alcohol dehydrogenase catalytic domain-containing protein [Propionibacteriaceae bacterium]|nr:alcohol dehydrogenase catalytic domain-containing protein [Propionibacteriaceae bacterium]